MPALCALTSAMPAPMSPAPRTATVSAWREGLPKRFFLSAVIPKKMERRAADSGVITSLPNSSASLS